MKPLRATLDEYLALRRSLGHKLCEEGGLLRQFVALAGERGAKFITTDLA
jgi:integrase/recombinase XerD